MQKAPSNDDGFREFSELVCSIVRVPNPQHNVNGQPGEAALAKAVVAWLSARNIKSECDLEWGVHASISGPEGAGTTPGILLAAHLDSDHLNVNDLDAVRVEGNQLLTPGQVGLDCKTGVAIALSVLERLRRRRVPGAWQVHVLFTVGEESGQKGAIRAPIGRLLAGKVRLGFVIDRMTRGSRAPRDENGFAVRHAVSAYKGVPLLEGKSGEELLRHLNSAVAAADPAAVGSLPLIESPNNADALELRGRFDAEVIGPSVQAPSAALSQALEQYRVTTSAVLQAMRVVAPEERVSSMYEKPRMPRYNAMRQVYQALHGGDVVSDERLAFSCVNLSYNYDDADATCDLEELDRTA